MNRNIHLMTYLRKFNCKCYFLVIFTLLGLVGCFFSQSRPFVPKSESGTNSLKNYSLGSSKQVFVGEALIVDGIEEFNLVNDGVYKSKITRDAGIWSVEKGGLYKAVAVDKIDGSIYLQIVPPMGILKISQEGRLADSKGYILNPNFQQIQEGLNTFGAIGEQVFEQSSASRRTDPKSYKIELLYLGKDGENIKVTYREYKDDFARPAFYQDLSYNLKESNTIRYKKYKILVKEATNESIKFIVIQDN